jgi:putative tryptophan/tyrosine transport system substrate-binding protein
MNRKFAWLVTPLLLACVHLAQAQQPKKIPRIGFVLGVGGSDSRFEAFRQGLRDLGYTEGKDMLLEGDQSQGRKSNRPDDSAECAGESG